MPLGGAAAFSRLRRLVFDGRLDCVPWVLAGSAAVDAGATAVFTTPIGPDKARWTTSGQSPARLRNCFVSPP